MNAISGIYFSVGEKPIYVNSNLMQQQDYTYSDIDSSSDIEEILNSDSNEESKLLYLTKMGFSEAEASIAMERCGPDSSIAELTDFICADQMAKVADVLLPVEDQITQRTLPEDAIGSPYFYYEQIHLSNPMIGFGVHTKSDQITQRTLPEDAIGSPYFYYENVALAPDLVWVGRNKIVPLEPDEVEMLLGYLILSWYTLKTNVQELNDDRLEQLMSRFGGFDLVVGHNGYNIVKEIDQHGKGSNAISRLEPASRYNQSVGSDLFMAL
ncbi:DNA (Cytosine-5)-methyltransferase DRM1/2 isoform 4 [Hibiscus syriacus]|uniref:DNA (Cytosine-5)-methyltransferase DRM1/2 isoform 4 n=1 Tax=Hibiscus syriacus TaxID=106335 RepID=A0A6A2Z3N3_HIBSY|nr:DNA (Cytosine-5)-methyltransferase DRM1/2 isoform 4 [Hibiscus syriacus]